MQNEMIIEKPGDLRRAFCYFHTIMLTSTAQAIALLAYGNDFLKNGRPHTDLFKQNSTFAHCNQVMFARSSKSFFLSRVKEKIVANDPAEWFVQLKKAGCRKLHLHSISARSQLRTPEHMTAGFVGGGRQIFIAAVYDKRSEEYWANRWAVSNPDAPDQKIWSVKYETVELKDPGQVVMELANIKETFYNTLRDIADFAGSNEEPFWKDRFVKAQLILDSNEPEKQYCHQDLLPPDTYSLLARQVLFAAGEAWVFGGMGSWNDMGFPDKETNELYERLSRQLYMDINNAIIAAVNSF